MHNKFTQKARNTLKNAQTEAGALGHSYVGSEHILIGLAIEKDSMAARILSARGIDHVKLRTKITELVGEGEKYKPGPVDMTPRAKRIVELSGEIATAKGCTYVGTEHILHAIIGESDSTATKLIESCGVALYDLRSDLNTHQTSTSLAPLSDVKETQRSKKMSPLLSLYAHDITEDAALGKTDPLIGREDEIERIIRILSRRGKNNPCLVGEPGVGKTAVVEGLAKRIADGLVPPTLQGKRILCLDIPAMIAGAKYRGEFEERLKNVMNEAEKDPDILLFIDELHVIIGAGAAEGAVDAANILKPALARRGIRLIGATTLAEYKKHIERDAALERRFQAVFIDEPDQATAISILRGLKERYEAHHRLNISDEAICAAVRLSARYISDRFLPDKALDLIDEAAAKMSIAAYEIFPDVPMLESQLSELKKKKEEYIFSQDFASAATLRDKEEELRKKLDSIKREMKKKKHSGLFELTEEQVAEIVTQQTGIPVSKLLAADSQALMGLEEKLTARVVGQEQAIDSVCKAIRRGRIGLGLPCRPVGSFIFLGKTGVGKTKLAVSVAEELLGSKKALIRFDMSEFMEKHSVSRLIGSPPGYVGYGEGGQLTEAVRRRPYCVLLFDEIEKAHADVFNLLLQILEDGRLSDAQGRSVDFSNAIIIMTSNAGVSEDRKVTGFLADQESVDGRRKRMISALENVFSPEFLGRVDEIVIFNDLSEEDLEKIAAEMLDSLSARAEFLGIHLNFDLSVARLLATKCSFDVHGARSLRQLVTTYAEDLITQKLLMGDIPLGSNVTVTVQNEELILASIQK